MTTESISTTIQELAEVIADQNCQIRELQATTEEQDELLVEYELEQENVEKLDAALYADLHDALTACTDENTSETLQDIIERYYGECDFGDTK
jgi:hypothetical protein